MHSDACELICSVICEHGYRIEKSSHQKSASNQSKKYYKRLDIYKELRSTVHKGHNSTWKSQKVNNGGIKRYCT